MQSRVGRDRRSRSCRSGADVHHGREPPRAVPGVGVAMGLSAGNLRQRVTIQSPTSASDGAGGSVTTWTNGATVWAEVLPVNGGEAFKAGLASATQFYKVTIRFRTDVTPRNRLMWNGIPLNIRTCADLDGRREALLMSAESGAPEPA